MTGKIPIRRLDLDEKSDEVRILVYGKPSVSIVYDTDETPEGTELYIDVGGNFYYFNKSGKLIDSDSQ